MLVLSDSGGSEVRNARARVVCSFIDVQNYAFLAGRQYGESEFGTTTYWLEVSMNHPARVDVVEALHNIEQLISEVSMGSSQ